MVGGDFLVPVNQAETGSDINKELQKDQSGRPVKSNGQISLQDLIE
jgi:hypothetical protein